MWNRFWCLALALAVGGLTGCRVPEPPPFDPRALQQRERQRALEVHPRPMEPLPTELQSPFLETNRNQAEPREAPQPPPAGPAIDPEQALRMSLQEVVQRAVAHNLDARVAGYGIAIEETRVVEAQARFDPTFFASLGFEQRDRATAGTTLPNPLNPFAPPILLDQEDSQSITGQAGVRQVLPSGGQVELSYRMARTDIRPERFLINPAYETDLILQVTQPLLRDFGRTVNRARITVARNNQHISLLEFRRSLEDVVTEIERIYWQLTLTEQEVRIQEDLLERTEQTALILFRRRGQDVTRVQISQANAQIEIRRAALVRARARVLDLSDQLKRLMNDPDLAVAEAAVVLPSVTPIEEPLRFDLPDQVATALENRSELAQQQLRVNSAGIIARVSRNNLLPALNAVLSAGLQGLGDDFGEAFRDQGRADFVSYGVGIQLEVPIGNRAARAIHQRSLLQRQQAIDQYRNQIEQIVLEVKAATRDIETSWDEMHATRQARFAAEDALLAIQQQEDAGVALSPTFVQLKLNTQSDLAEAQRAQAAAVVNYNVAISRLERAKGTILRYNNILLEEEPRPFLW